MGEQSHRDAHQIRSDVLVRAEQRIGDGGSEVVGGHGRSLPSG